jgi:hypothetical protein
VKKTWGGNLQAPDAKPKRRRRSKGMCLEDRPVLEPNAVGIDVGAREMFVAVPPGRDENPVRVFATFTEDLERLTDWLEQCGVTTVSAGIHWSLLDSTVQDSRTTRHPPCLVNARHMKNVPGRRTDWHECQFQQPRLSSRALGPRKLMKSRSERVSNRLRGDGELTFDPVYDNWSEPLRISIVNAP